MDEGRQPGILAVVAVGVLVVAIVLLVEIGTRSFAPAMQALYGLPIVILVLLGGTAWVLMRLVRRS